MRNRVLGLVLVLSGLGSAVWAQDTVTASYNGYPIPIMPDYWDTISVASITVPKALKMTKVTVKVNITYPQIGDLNLFLYSPDGTRTKLLEHNCGDKRIVDATFDDAASSLYNQACPADGRGTYRANEPLSNFNSADSSIGLWVLAVENNSSDSRAGWLNDVTLTITGTSQAKPYFRSDQILNTANLRSGAVAPGQVASITGSSLGPTDPVITGAGAWPTELGGVKVSVNGTNVPIRYAAASRIDVQMPFNLPGPTANIQVTYSTNVSDAVPVPVQASFPGLFAQRSGGTGQAKAANQDGTLNSVTNPAKRGSYVTVYGIGLGAVNPSAVAGQVPPTSPLSLAVNPVAASIGGVPATVSFAGLAPGYAGLYQINILVPDAVADGAQEVIVSNANVASQNGLVIQIK
jgi:uncharacterized protein (TIGR03437 family)